MLFTPGSLVLSNIYRVGVKLLVPWILKISELSYTITMFGQIYVGVTKFCERGNHIITYNVNDLSKFLLCGSPQKCKNNAI